MDENKFKDLHEILMKNIDIGGLYRSVNITVKGSEYAPPSYEKIRDRMRQYFETLANPIDDNNVIETIAYSHLQLSKIHPFVDGNGKLSRIILNYYLMKSGFFPIVIELNDKDKYFHTIEEFKTSKNMKPFIDFILKLEEEEIKKH
jgi:Fic family protein